MTAACGGNTCTDRPKRFAGSWSTSPATRSHMHPPDPLHICTTCRDGPHYDNCSRCLGFGLGNDGAVLSGRESLDAFNREFSVPCPVCGSDTSGVPPTAVTRA